MLFLPLFLQGSNYFKMMLEVPNFLYFTGQFLLVGLLATLRVPFLIKPHVLFSVLYYVSSISIWFPGACLQGVTHSPCISYLAVIEKNMLFRIATLPLIRKFSVRPLRPSADIFLPYQIYFLIPERSSQLSLAHDHAIVISVYTTSSSLPCACSGPSHPPRPRISLFYSLNLVKIGSSSLIHHAPHTPCT